MHLFIHNIYMVVGAPDISKRGQPRTRYTAQRPGPWDRDSNIVAADV